MADFIRLHTVSGAPFFIRTPRIMDMARMPETKTPLNFTSGDGKQCFSTRLEHTKIHLYGTAHPIEVRETPDEIAKLIDDDDPLVEIKQRLKNIEDLLLIRKQFDATQTR